MCYSHCNSQLCVNKSRKLEKLIPRHGDEVFLHIGRDWINVIVYELPLTQYVNNYSPRMSYTL